MRCAVRSLSKKTALPPGMDTVEIGDIGPSTAWDTALEGIDAVVHLAARVHVTVESTFDPITAYREINVGGTRRLAQMAQTKKVKRFVYVSSIKVNGEGRFNPYTEADQPAPADPYGISKFEAEMELHRIADKTCMDVAVLRPPLVYGPEVKANFFAADKNDRPRHSVAPSRRHKQAKHDFLGKPRGCAIHVFDSSCSCRKNVFS